MKIQIKFLALVVVGLMTTSALAEAPAGYYNGLSGLKDAELKTAVSKLARNFTRSGSYGTIYSNLKYTFQKPISIPIASVGGICIRIRRSMRRLSEASIASTLSPNRGGEVLPTFRRM